MYTMSLGDSGGKWAGKRYSECLLPSIVSVRFVNGKGSTSQDCKVILQAMCPPDSQSSCSSKMESDMEERASLARPPESSTVRLREEPIPGFSNDCC